MDMQPFATHLMNFRVRAQQFFRMHGRYVVIGLVAILLFLIAGLIFALRALPGEPLYPTKTRVLEPIAHAVHFTPRMQAAYSARVLEARLHELQTLATDSATTSPEALGTFASLVEREVYRADASLAASSLSDEKALDRHLTILGLIDAHQTLIRSTLELTPIEETIENARGEAFTALESRAHTFASTSPEAAGSYLGEQLRILEGELSQIARGSSAELRASARLRDAQDAIAEGDTGAALVFVLRARQAIAVDRHLFDSERGPQGGTPQAPTTEGQ